VWSARCGRAALACLGSLLTLRLIHIELGLCGTRLLRHRRATCEENESQQVPFHGVSRPTKHDSSLSGLCHFVLTRNFSWVVPHFFLNEVFRPGFLHLVARGPAHNPARVA